MVPQKALKSFCDARLAYVDVVPLRIEDSTVVDDLLKGKVDLRTVGQSEDDPAEPRCGRLIYGWIQTAESGEDIVQTENVSECGACFKSQKKYLGRASVSGAIPFTAFAANVFVRARITWGHCTHVEGLTAHGLVYFHARRRAKRIRPRTRTGIGFIAGGFRFIGTLVDMSVNGVLVQSSEQAKPGDVIKLRIKKPQKLIRQTGVAGMLSHASIQVLNLRA